MKARVKHRKESGKAIHHYVMCHGFHPPYRVLIDDSCLRACVMSGIHNPKERFVALLGHGHVTPCTHDIILESLRKAATSAADQEALKMAQQFLYVAVKNVTTVADCCREWCRQRNGSSVVIATQDPVVRAAVRQFPEVPTVRVDRRTGHLIVDPPTRQSAFEGHTGARHVQVREVQMQRDRVVVDQLRSKGLAAPQEGTESLLPKAPHPTKRRPIQGPNSLSCKPKKVKLLLDGSGGGLSWNEKRPRDREENKEGKSMAPSSSDLPITPVEEVSAIKRRKVRRGVKHH